MFRDTLIVDKARVNSDGFMAVRARAARTGIYDYLGSEIDPEGKHFAADQIVKVYRPPEEVFDKASLASYVGKPITDDHPATPVDSTNWRDHAGGTIMGASREIADEGDFITFDLAFMDQKLIQQIDAGKRELSNGYGADIVIQDGVTPDGEPYQAIQTNMRGNHVAVVKNGRAGAACRIGDAARCDVIDANAIKSELISSRTYADPIGDAKTGSTDKPKEADPMPKMILIDGLQVDISNVDTAEATIKTLQGKVTDANARADKAETDVATLTTDKAKLEAEKATLEKQLADSKPTPAMLRDAAKSYALVADKARALDVKFEDAADEGEIKRAVVDAKLGDLAKDWTDEQVAASFASLTADVKLTDRKPSSNNLRDTIMSGPKSTHANLNDGMSSLRNRRLRDMETRYSKTARDMDEEEDDPHMKAM